MASRPKAPSRPKPRGAQVMVALLRGINVGGHKIVPMADLRRVAEGVGLRDVATFIQSGNLLFATTLAPAAAELALEKAIDKEFGFPVPVVARTADAWRTYASRTPFPDAEKSRPQLLHLGLAKHPLKSGAVAALQEVAAPGERVAALPDALWIDYAQGAGRSKLAPAILDRACGSTVTARNWRTVQKLAELLAARDADASGV